MELNDRIKAAIYRITQGMAPMRVPPDESDPDLVLCDCEKEIARLTQVAIDTESAKDAELRALREERARLKETLEASDNYRDFLRLQESEAALREENARLKAGNEFGQIHATQRSERIKDLEAENTALRAQLREAEAVVDSVPGNCDGPAFGLACLYRQAHPKEA